MFYYRKRFEINIHEFVDFVRLLGRYGLKFKFSDKYEVTSERDEDKKEQFRRFDVFGTRRQLSEFMETRDIILNYHLH